VKKKVIFSVAVIFCLLALLGYFWEKRTFVRLPTESVAKQLILNYEIQEGILCAIVTIPPALSIENTKYENIRVFISQTYCSKFRYGEVIVEARIEYERVTNFDGFFLNKNTYIPAWNEKENERRVESYLLNRIGERWNVLGYIAPNGETTAYNKIKRLMEKIH